jgi:exopolysaccharide biosynthesis polyprenyl glycosylphosphotransferase
MREPADLEAAAPVRAPAGRPPPEPLDVRRRRPYALTRGFAQRLARGALRVGTLLAIDLTGLVLGLYLALVVRQLVRGETELLWGLLWDGPAEWAPPIGIVLVLVFWQSGLYRSREHRHGISRVIGSLAVVTVVTVALALVSGHEFNTFGLVPTAFVTVAVVIGLMRASYESVTEWILQRSGVRRRVVLVGAEHRLTSLRRSLGPARDGIAYQIVGAVRVGRGRRGNGAAPIASLADVLDAGPVDEVIVETSDLADDELLEMVDIAHAHEASVLVAPHTTALLTRRAEYVPGQKAPLFEVHPPVFLGAEWLGKRAFDVVVSSLVLVVGLPIWLLIALAIKVESRGPVLFRQPRVGLHERDFTMLKFRTMDERAAAQQEALEASNEAPGALFKIRHDPRVTRVGRVLRRLSLDEIPQLVNVLRGEMSLVGPRPLPRRDHVQLEPWHVKRTLVLPGLTGVWQISGRSNLSFDDLVRLDFYYIDNWSIWLDIAILIKTAGAVLTGRGAY